MSQLWDATASITNAVGLHARPAANFVQTAQGFKSRIRVSAKGREVDGKSLIGILSLGVRQGMDIHIQAEGEDAEQAIRALLETIEAQQG